MIVLLAFLPLQAWAGIGATPSGTALVQPAHAVANGYFVGAINRVGTEAPWNIGKFYGSSYFVDPRGNFLAMANEDDDAVVVAEMDLDQIEEVRNIWQFYRDRRPETYGRLTEI